MPPPPPPPPGPPPPPAPGPAAAPALNKKDEAARAKMLASLQKGSSITKGLRKVPDSEKNDKSAPAIGPPAGAAAAKSLYHLHSFSFASKPFCQIGRLNFQTVKDILHICSHFRLRSRRYHAEWKKLMSECSGRLDKLTRFLHLA